MSPEKRAELGRKIAADKADRLHRLGTLARSSPLAMPVRRPRPPKSKAKSGG